MTTKRTSSLNMLPYFISESIIDKTIEHALAEDLGPGDATTKATIPQSAKATSRFMCKATGVIAGLHVARRVFHHLDPSMHVEWAYADGEYVENGALIGRVTGLAHPMLSAERIALNFMQRMSGIATATQRMVQAIDPLTTKVLDTRKTAPGLRPFDKWAVKLGGGHNHRIGLYDLILIKDNHIAAAGGIKAAIEAANHFKNTHKEPLRIEIETSTLAEVDEVLAIGGVDIIMLDNMVRREDDGSFNVDMLHQAVQKIGGQCETEASGNVTEESVALIAATGVDAISSGALTHSVQALDISMKTEINI